MPVQRFAHYEVLGRLATGGAANIFVARESLPDGSRRLLCLKTLRPELAQREDFVAMFVDEARLVAQFDHDACVDIFGYGRERDVLYIALEYILGESITELIRAIANTPSDRIAVAATAIAAAADGLHHAHELCDLAGRPYNLVHRDVSPENILVTYAGHTKVLDFGIAKAETGRAQTATGVIKGKFAYMSPEQIMAVPLDRRSDVFSLGAVLHECITQRPLYGPATPREVAAQILGMPAARLSATVSRVPQELDDVCATALEREPAARYATAADFASALRGVLKRSGIEGGPTAVTRLVDQRIGARVDRRKKACGAALAEDLDLSGVIRELGLRPVLAIDLLPSLKTPKRSRQGRDKDSVLSKVPVRRSATGWAVEVARLRAESLPDGAPEDTVHDPSPLGEASGRKSDPGGDELVTIDAAALEPALRAALEDEATAPLYEDDEDPTVAQAGGVSVKPRAYTEVRKYLAEQSAPEEITGRDVANRKRSTPVVYAKSVPPASTTERAPPSDGVGGPGQQRARLSPRADSETERADRSVLDAAAVAGRPSIRPDDTTMTYDVLDALPLTIALPLFAVGTSIGLVLGVVLGRGLFI